jgi:hypothetical protein
MKLLPVGFVLAASATMNVESELRAAEERIFSR